MKYIKFTYVDSVTNISVTTAPVQNESIFPKISGLTFNWLKSHKTPTSVPEFFGTCDSNANTNVDGVLEVLSKETYDELYEQELDSRFFGKQTISAKQIRLRLLEQDLLMQTTEAVKTLPQNLQIEWEYGTELYRKSDLIKSIKQTLNLSQDKIDEIFFDDDRYLYLQNTRKQEKELLESIENGTPL
jgi:hypothetical protein